MNALNRSLVEPSASLSARLRACTVQAHQQAEAVPFVQALFSGQFERGPYLAYLQSLRAVYATLEAGLRGKRKDARLAPLVRPEVFREQALTADLAWFEAPVASPSAATTRYVEHLQRLTTSAPHLLIAHAYTRTLGDLSGGQLLGRAVRARFALKSVEGARFYEFAIPQLGAFKQAYRETLDGLPLSAVEGDQVVAEAVQAFELNTAMLAALTA
jgi:heme oxygenase